MPTPAVPTSTEWRIRSFGDGDQRACEGLYSAGIISGSLAPNDTAFDIADIAAAYTKNAGSHFWVATMNDGEVVGMIGVQHHEAGIGEIRRLRVAQERRRRGIGSALVEAAVRFCGEQQYLKVAVDTYVDQEAVIKLLAKFHFRLSRKKQVGERETMYFYLDLYEGED